MILRTFWRAAVESLPTVECTMAYRGRRQSGLDALGRPSYGKFSPAPRLTSITVAAMCLAVFLPISQSTAQVAVVPDAEQAGGEPDGIVQVANLVYAGTKSSRCFADHFLIKVEKDSAISTSRRFHAVKLHGKSIYEFPLVIMTGEGTFHLADAERDNLRRYVERGGFLLASAGCSSTEWDRSFRREMATVFPDNALQSVTLEHPIFHTVYDIKGLKAKHGTPRPLEAVSLDGRVGVIYSQDGLNDTGHTTGCCCCGGNELSNAEDINVNILAYALMY